MLPLLGRGFFLINGGNLWLMGYWIIGLLGCRFLKAGRRERWEGRGERWEVSDEDEIDLFQLLSVCGYNSIVPEVNHLLVVWTNIFLINKQPRMGLQ